MTQVPQLHRWNSILMKDAYTVCSRAQTCSPGVRCPGNISFRKDGTLKDPAGIKKAITTQSRKYFMNLDLEEISKQDTGPVILLKRSKHHSRDFPKAGPRRYVITFSCTYPNNI